MLKSKNKLSFEGLEIVYGALAEGIDKAGEQNEALFLAKLVLLLAHEQGDTTVFQRCLETALTDMLG
jgi:hypothetical protein